MRAMPAGRERVLLLLLRIDNVDLSLAEAERGLDRFDDPRAILVGDFDPVLDDLNTRAEPLDLCRIVNAHDFVVDPDAEIPLLLEEFEILARVGLRGNADPKRNKNIFVRAITQHFVGN